MKYNNHLNYRDRRRYLLKVRLVLILVFGSILTLIGYMFYSVMNDDSSNTAQTTTSESTNSYFAPSINVFKTPYFQFQADKTWGEVPAESTQSKFVYRSLRSSLIEHELVIYVNQVPANLETTRVLPVNLKSNNSEMLPLNISNHCSEALGGKTSNRAQEVLIEKVTIMCDSDSTMYTVMAGLVDSSTNIRLDRPDGTSAVYALRYNNLRATPDSSQFTQILNTFQSR